MPAEQEFRLPDLGEGLTEAEVVRWLVRPGDRVRVDENVVEVETAKALVEMPCPYAGVVTAIHAAEGETIPVGHVLISVVPNGDDDGDVPTDPGEPAEPERVLVGYGSTPAPRPRRARVRTASLDRAPDNAAQEIPLQGLRAATAAKVELAHREIPAATCWLDTDATELLAVKEELSVSMPALLARICAVALARQPTLNSTVDSERATVLRWPDVHMGIAVDTERGLVVPVVRDAQRLSLIELDRALHRLVAAAKAGSLLPSELSGGTFTLNNYGVLGVDGSAPILNHPQAAMVGVGRIVDRPWVHEGRLTVRKVVHVSLTFDHRVCDGGEAAGFLRYIADCLAAPSRVLSG